MALDALAEGIHTRKVNWVLDADIRGFFDTIDHEWLMRFVEHRIRDRRVLRHIKKWLHAGVLEDFSYVSTAGGAFLQWLEGKTLPGVKALEAAA